MNYKEYSAIINVAFNEEVQRLEEWIYSINTGIDCSEDKYWIKETPGGDIPSLEELTGILSSTEEIRYLDLFSDDDDVVDEVVGLIRDEWMTM
jgi:hypothetical protein|tara:strand:- start:1057 stop:1335 length:279 start_codon:yes stop_codon:yes gene_type:complete